jgi:tetratricopeptide (TPR) repeat protein
VSPSELRSYSEIALKQGKPALALEMAIALLQRDPKDQFALIVKSQAHRDLGQYDAAERAARKAWALAQTDPAKYAASLAMAQSLSTRGARVRAQLWARRAIQHAPFDTSKARAARDLKLIRHFSKWHHALSFGFAPTSNINNGTFNEKFTGYFGLEYEATAAARALTGWEYSFGSHSRYRLHDSKASQSELVLQTYYRGYALSQSAQDAAPEISGSDFALGVANISYLYRWHDAQQANLEASIGAGHVWYGGSSYAHTAQLSFSRTSRLSDNKSLTLYSGVHFLNVTDPDRDDSHSYKLGTVYTQTTENKHMVTLGLDLARTLSQDSASDFSAAELSLGYRIPKAFRDIDLALTTKFGWKQFKEYPFISGGRRDFSLRTEAKFAFNNIEYYGFIPNVTIGAQKTESTYGRFDTETLTLSFGFQTKY